MPKLPATFLQPGDKAPDFELPDNHGGSFRLGAHKGRPVVLEFYCEDGTEGCEIENREFSVLKPEFDRLGVDLVGISPQDLESHGKFAAKNGLLQPLLADTELVANKAYGVWQLKKLWGREYMGTIRMTYLIDASGKVAAAIKASRIKGHAATVLEAAKALVRKA
ncbi:MAG: peroxiredoxin [Devosia sp.]